MLEESGHRAAMTRITDRTVPLRERVRMERNGNYDLLVSVHCNAAENPSARGMEIWTSPGQTRADAAATAIFNALQKAFGRALPMRMDLSDGDPDKEARFYMLTHSRCPAVLIELGFLSNTQDREFLTDPENQTDIAAVIAEGIEGWGRGRGRVNYEG
jgi:N-acetylmuramoyl-L-alanine amidase